ncbi:integrase, catalytic region, zinc finger, CCHC-type containing protein, partial [Tanacetum coccineum]
MYQIDTRTTQTRAPQLSQTSRNTNPRVSTSTGVTHRTNVSRPQPRSTQMKDKVVPNNSQVKVKKTEVEDHPRISSIYDKTKFVIACNDSLKSRNLNVNAVCATCGNYLFNSDHYARVSKFLNDVNAKTKKPNVVPISTRKPKSQANKSVATPPKKTVASESTIQKSKSYYRMLYKKTSKAWKWWIEQQCPSGYKWVPKTKMKWVPKPKNENVKKRVSFAIDNIVQLILFIVDSGCTKHMTGNLKLLCNFVEKYLGTVRFGNDQFALILGYGDLVQGNIMINMVYYVEGLNHNLFSVGQFVMWIWRLLYGNLLVLLEIFRESIYSLEVPIRADSSWGWRKLLQLRDTVRPFFVLTLGDGMNTSVLFDNWYLRSPLSLRIMPCDVSNAGFNLACRVADFVVNGVWNWPQTWTLKVPDIAFIPAPNLDPNKRDLIHWRSKNGRLSMFSVSKAWEDLRPRRFEVCWTRIVWYSHCIPSHDFHLWLTLRGSLKTQDKLRQGDVGTADLTTLCFPLCYMVLDSHSHLFFECSFSSHVWCLVWFNLACRVADFVVNGVWNWPQTWTLKVPDVAFIPAPNHANKCDLIHWRSKNGRLSIFSVSKAWEDLRPHGFEVRWTHVVWYSHCIPSHAFHLWLTLRRSLKTQDKLRQGDVGTTDLTTLRCPLCNMVPDS